MYRYFNGPNVCDCCSIRMAVFHQSCEKVKKKRNFDLKMLYDTDSDWTKASFCRDIFTWDFMDIAKHYQIVLLLLGTLEVL